MTRTTPGAGARTSTRKAASSHLAPRRAGRRGALRTSRRSPDDIGGNIMRHTLVAVFDNRSDAQNALDELLASGFSRTDASLSSADPTGQTDSVTGDNELLTGTH